MVKPTIQHSEFRSSVCPHAGETASEAVIVKENCGCGRLTILTHLFPGLGLGQDLEASSCDVLGIGGVDQQA